MVNRWYFQTLKVVSGYVRQSLPPRRTLTISPRHDSMHRSLARCISDGWPQKRQIIATHWYTRIYFMCEMSPPKTPRWLNIDGKFSWPTFSIQTPKKPKWIAMSCSWSSIRKIGEMANRLETSIHVSDHWKWRRMCSNKNSEIYSTTTTWFCCQAICLDRIDSCLSSSTITFTREIS